MLIPLIRLISRERGRARSPSVSERTYQINFRAARKAKVAGARDDDWVMLILITKVRGKGQKLYTSSRTATATGNVL